MHNSTVIRKQNNRTRAAQSSKHGVGTGVLKCILHAMDKASKEKEKKEQENRGQVNIGCRTEEEGVEKHS